MGGGGGENFTDRRQKPRLGGVKMAADAILALTYSEIMDLAECLCGAVAIDDIARTDMIDGLLAWSRLQRRVI